MSFNPNSSTKRKRGIALTARGLRRLNQAIQEAEVAENQGKRFTAEELSKRSGISTSTLSRIWASKSGADRRTLNLLFNAFKLDLLDSDLHQCPEEIESPPSQLWVDSPPDALSMPYPSGPVPVDSDRYIRRPEIDDRALQEILQPGCVIRIKAPSGFGKTSLLLRLLHYAKQQGYVTAAIDLQQADTETLTDPHTFLRWFCAVLCRKVNCETNLDQYWDDLLGSKLSTTLCFREAILAPLSHPLVLVFNEVERVFEYPDTAKNLLPLLRSWHEEAQHDEVWKRLRLVVSYSTDAYLPL
ncbi:MAG TPA: AAA-like domain-containing protein, partial [Allocoleopsis sp.]